MSTQQPDTHTTTVEFKNEKGDVETHEVVRQHNTENKIQEPTKDINKILEKSDSSVAADQLLREETNKNPIRQ